MITVSTTGMVVSLKTDLRFPIPGQQGHGGRIIQNSFSVDEREHVVTMKIPHAELKDLNVKKVEIAEVKKGTLAFGKIKLSAEDSDKVDNEVEKKMLKKLEDENEAEKADEFAKTVVWETFYPMIAKVSPGYSLEIEFK